MNLPILTKLNSSSTQLKWETNLLCQKLRVFFINKVREL